VATTLLTLGPTSRITSRLPVIVLPSFALRCCWHGNEQTGQYSSAFHTRQTGRWIAPPARSPSPDLMPRTPNTSSSCRP
jgi:hypothetical protein